MKQETIEDIAKWVIEFRITKNEYARVSDFEMYNTIIKKVSKWQQENSYSEQDMIDFAYKYIDERRDQGARAMTPELLIKQFKNKQYEKTIRKTFRLDQF